jgi:hypothetical protein
MIRSFWLIVFVLFSDLLFGQEVTISGRAPDYAGKDLSFYTFPEPVSHLQKRLAETKVAQDGQFNLSLKTNQTIEIYADLEKYRGTLVVEPGAHYEISLPAFSPRTQQEAASPYFQPELYWLGIKGTKKTDLNFLVRAFLTDYNRELSMHTLEIYQKRSGDSAKAIMGRLDKNYPTGKIQYLDILKMYSFAELEYALTQPDKEFVAKKYFATREVFLSHPTYQHLFQSLFSDYLTYKFQDIKQKGMVTSALKGNFEEFIDQLISAGYKREPAELVATKCFYDGFYSNRFDKKNMMKGLRQANNQATFEPLRIILPDILCKITSLQEGGQAPVLLLKNQKDETISVPSKGKFVYLAFFKSNSRSCRAEMDSLVSIGKKLNSILTIVPVSLDQNFQDAVRLWGEKKYPWDLAKAIESEKIMADYQIKSVPTFYLISPENRMLLAPALPPSHNFESLFLKILREQKFKNQAK